MDPNVVDYNIIVNESEIFAQEKSEEEKVEESTIIRLVKMQFKMKEFVKVPNMFPLNLLKQICKNVLHGQKK
jgi:hypothetical protein